MFSRLLKQFEKPIFLSSRLPAQDNSAKPNKRAWERFPIKVEVFCQNTRGENEPQWSALVLDISRGGLKLSIPRRFEPKTIVRIARAVGWEESSQFHEAVVVRASREPKGKWFLGCAFVQELSEEALPEWLERNE